MRRLRLLVVPLLLAACAAGAFGQDPTTASRPPGTGGTTPLDDTRWRTVGGYALGPFEVCCCCGTVVLIIGAAGLLAWVMMRRRGGTPGERPLPGRPDQPPVPPDGGRSPREDITTRLQADGFWLTAPDVVPGQIVRYRCRVGGATRGGEVAYTGGSAGQFVPTGGTPADVEILGVVPPDADAGGIPGDQLPGPRGPAS